MANTIQGHEAVGGATKRGAPDTSVMVPPAVKAAADRADALVKQAQEAKATAPAGNDQPIGASLKPPAERVPTGVVTANFDPNDPNPPRDVPAAPQPQAPTPQTPEDWEHQFKSLKGRYDRESEDKRTWRGSYKKRSACWRRSRLLPRPPYGAGRGVGGALRCAPASRSQGHPAEVTEYGNELMDVVGRRAQK